MALSAEEQALLNGEKRNLPFLPALGGWYNEEEVEALTQALRESMEWRVGFTGNDIAEFEREFAEYCDVKYAFAVNSCGTGLDGAMQALNLGPEDEVIVPAITYIATAQAVVGVGAKIVLAECHPDTFNIDPNDVERRMTANTRAIMPVHNNGLSADMDALADIAERHPHAVHGPAPVVGDAARAAGGGYKGTRVGKRGAMNIFSFQTTKNMTTLGEGGMVTTDDDDYAAYINSSRSFGWGLKGWGSNYRLTKLQAVAGRIQLARLDEMNDLRRDRALLLSACLADAPGVIVPQTPAGYDHVWYGYTVMLESEWAGEPRDKVTEHMQSEYGVGGGIMNAALPDYDSILNKLGHTPEDVPVSTDIGRRLFCPSLHPLMSDDDVRYVAASIKASMQEVSATVGVAAAAG